jgi:hypothetical protein
MRKRVTTAFVAFGLTVLADFAAVARRAGAEGFRREEAGAGPRRGVRAKIRKF